MALPIAAPEQYERLGSQLCDAEVAIATKMRNVFTLKNLGGDAAVDALCKGFDDRSALLRHEVAYVLGQLGNAAALPKLTEVLRRESEDAMVRHEAAEALGAIGEEASLAVLEEFVDSNVRPVAETCQIAIDLIKWRQSQEAVAGSDKYTSVDPAPPTKEEQPIAELRELLLDTKQPLFMRYRALFALRNRGGEEAVKALAAALDDESALLKHEVAFVLGQMQDSAAIDALTAVLQRDNEDAMVRHEAAEALGAISLSTEDVLKQFADDKQDVVRESCLVALDIAEYNEAEDFQYADGLSRA